MGKINWSQVEIDFCEGAKEVIAKMAKSGKKEKSLTFWVHVDYPPVFVYTADEGDGDGAAEFWVESLFESYEDEDREVDYQALEKKIFKHFGNACMKLKEENAFDPLVEDYMSIWVATVDTDRKQICTVGDMSEAKGLFEEEKKLKFDLTMIGKGRAKEQWWWADYKTNYEDEVKFKPTKYEIEKKLGIDFTTWYGESMADKGLPTFKTSLKSTTKLLDWMWADEHEVWSYKLCALMDAIGVKNIEYYPLTISHKTLKQKSKSYYKLANIVGVSNAVESTGYDQPDCFENLDSIGFEEDHLKGNKKKLDKIKLKIFRAKSGRNHGLVMDNDLKMAIEANGISGIEFKEIPFWQSNRMAQLEKLHKEGNLGATLRLGLAYMKGEEVEKDKKKALELIEAVLFGDSKEARKELCDGYLERGRNAETKWGKYVIGVNYHLNDKLDRAEKILQEASDLGYKRAAKYLKKLKSNPLNNLDWKDWGFWKKLSLKDIQKLVSNGADFSEELDQVMHFGAKKEVFEFLLEKQGDKINTKVNQFGHSLLMNAFGYKKSYVKALVNAGANVNHIDNYKNTVLSFAKSMEQDQEIIDLLTEKGAK
jgi:TPR repeat protein